MIRNEKGFTLIEIIAVLVLLGILAVIAVPKYLDVAAQGRIMAAQGAIAEVKSRLSTAQGRYMLANNGTAPNGPTLYTYATNSSQYGTNLGAMGSDFNVVVASGAPITITVDIVGGTTVTPSVVGNFNAAGD